MSILAALLGAALVVQSPEPVVKLGSYRIGDRTVQATVPSGFGGIDLSTGTFDADGWTFAISLKGAVVRRFKKGGGWSDVAERWQQGQNNLASAPIWRIKVFLFPRVSILDEGNDGVVRLRRGGIEPSQYQGIYDSLARFASMAEADAEGHIRIEFDFEIDSDPISWTATKDRWPGLDGTLETIVENRINRFGFEAEDRTYRGPYHQVFVLHSGLSNTSGLGTSMPIVHLGIGKGQFALTMELYRSWLQRVSHFAQTAGYSIGNSLAHGQSSIGEEAELGYDPGLGIQLPTDMWTTLASLSPTNTAQFLAHRAPTLGSKLADLKDGSQFLTLWPKLSRRQVDELLDLGSPLSLFRFDSAELASTAVADKKGNHYLFVRPPFVSLFINHSKPGLSLKPIGWFEYGNAIACVFSVIGDPGKSDLDRLDIKEFPAMPMVNMAPRDLSPWNSRPDPTTVKPNGGLRVVAGSDAERGSILEIPSPGLNRSGKLVLFGKSGTTLFDGSANRYVSFWVHADHPEPMELWVYGLNGKIAMFGLFGQQRTPAELSGNTYPDVLELPLGKWAQATVLLPEGFGPVERIVFSTARYTDFWDRTQNAPGQIRLGEFSASPTGTPTRFAVPEAPAPDSEEAKAAFYANLPDAPNQDDLNQAIRWLSDRSVLVRLNAAKAFTRIVEPKAVATLSDWARGIEPRLSEIAMKALIRQGTSEARAAIRQGLDYGPYDHTRAFAALALGSKDQPDLAGPISVLLASRSWKGRMAGVEALAKIGTKQASHISMAFLLEVEPNVRLAVTRLADVSDDLVCRRILWSAVNDPNDSVRLLSYQRLFESPLSGMRAEALKGVRDDGVQVRKSFVLWLAKQPGADVKAALKLGLADILPEVRAATLNGLAKGIHEFSLEDLGSLLRDPDPRVQVALAAYAEAKKIKLSPAGTPTMSSH